MIKNNSLHHLKSFNEALNSTFNFYEISSLPLYYIGYYEGNHKFCVTESNDLINQEGRDSEGKGITVTPLKSYRIGKSCLDLFNNSLIEGRFFNDNDFIINNSNQKINVVLGNAYKSVYHLGDTFKLSLLEKEINLKVIGFLKPNTSFNRAETMTQSEPENINLDTYIILPYYDIIYEPINDFDDAFQKRYYLQKNEGYIGIDGELDCSKFVRMSKELTKKADQAGFSYTCPPQYGYYLNEIEVLSLKYDLPYTISFSTILLKFPS